MSEQPNNIYFKTNEYENMPDEEVVKLIKQGDDDAFSYLCEKYKDIINVKVSKYYIIGAERDDTVQEGMIGLFKAIKSYDETKQNSFKTFANICVERQLITAIKSSNRQKHQPLNSYLSLNNSAYDNDDNDEELINTFDSKTIEDPLDTVMKKEYIAHIENTIDRTLSGFEKQVLNRYIKGESYVDIANKLDAPVKSVDNAIQRIRKKAIKNLYDDVN
ncbi:MAG: RNA polymerase sporulation sigma factor SigH [Clostridia bacterium]|nr:RNA polymerase sporulation sigma factor SigH [Clostridia bacterium]